MSSFIFIPINKTAEANAIAVSLDHGDEAEQLTFGGLRLSPTGEEPATHTACEINLPESLRGIVRKKVENLGGSYFDDTALFDVSPNEPMQIVNSFEMACECLGLSLIQPKDEL